MSLQNHDGEQPGKSLKELKKEDKETNTEKYQHLMNILKINLEKLSAQYNRSVTYFCTYNYTRKVGKLLMN